MKAFVRASDFAGAAALKAEMENDAEAQVASARCPAAAGDRHRQEQQQRLKEMVNARDFAGAAALQAEMQKEAEAEVAQGTSVEAPTERRVAPSGPILLFPLFLSLSFLFLYFFALYPIRRRTLLV